MRVLSRPEVGREVRAWFSKVFGACRSDWEALLPLRGEERECADAKCGLSCLQISPLFLMTDLAVYLLDRGDPTQVLGNWGRINNFLPITGCFPSFLNYTYVWLLLTWVWVPTEASAHGFSWSWEVVLKGAGH